VLVKREWRRKINCAKCAYFTLASEDYIDSNDSRGLRSSEKHGCSRSRVNHRLADRFEECDFFEFIDKGRYALDGILGLL